MNSPTTGGKKAGSLGVRLLAIAAVSTGIVSSGGCAGSGGAWTKAGVPLPARAKSCAVEETFDVYCTTRVGMACEEKIPELTGVAHSHVASANLDPSLTEDEGKRRNNPMCCYSWCAPLPSAAKAPADVTRGITTDYCIAAPPGGTRFPAAQPYEECPAAIDNSKSQGAFRSGSFSAERTSRRRNNIAGQQQPGAMCCYEYQEFLGVGRPLTVGKTVRLSSLVTWSDWP